MVSTGVGHYHHPTTLWGGGGDCKHDPYFSALFEENPWIFRCDNFLRRSDNLTQFTTLFIPGKFWFLIQSSSAMKFFETSIWKAVTHLFLHGDREKRLKRRILINSCHVFSNKTAIGYSGNFGSFLLTCPPPPTHTHTIGALNLTPRRSELVSDRLKFTRAWVETLRRFLFRIYIIVWRELNQWGGGGGGEVNRKDPKFPKLFEE